MNLAETIVAITEASGLITFRKEGSVLRISVDNRELVIDSYKTTALPSDIATDANLTIHLKWAWDKVKNKNINEKGTLEG